MKAPRVAKAAPYPPHSRKSAYGEKAERDFCLLAESFGFIHHRLQENRSSSAVATRCGKSRPLPDVLVQGRGSTIYVEVKRNSLTSDQTIGHESFRADSTVMQANASITCGSWRSRKG